MNKLYTCHNEQIYTIMKSKRLKGYTYEVITKPWKSGNNKYEVIKYKTGFKNFWERVPYEKYIQIPN